LNYAGQDSGVQLKAPGIDAMTPQIEVIGGDALAASGFKRGGSSWNLIPASWARIIPGQESGLGVDSHLLGGGRDDARWWVQASRIRVFVHQFATSFDCPSPFARLAQ